MPTKETRIDSGRSHDWHLPKMEGCMSTTSSSSSSPTFTGAALSACSQYPNSDVELALAFCAHAVPSFCLADNDRLVKVGRSIKNLVDMKDEEGVDLEKSLGLVVEECELLMSGKVKVPRVAFGKTGIQISVATLGCMRFQQAWGPHITNMNMVEADCQDNLVAILKRALLDFGINHIETARGYGCSELQLGAALKQLIMTSQIKRDDFILQTKVAPMKDPNVFRKTLEKSFESLGVDYLDLFAFHGLNLPIHLVWTFGDDKNKGDGTETCYSVVQEYVKAGKIRHVGFSTHAPTDFILEAINKDVFEYVNLHYQFIGSYTASGGGHDGQGNRDCVRLLNEKNMGVFIISPFDKGGALYCPSRKLRKLTLPDLEPMAFQCMHIWNHHQFHPGLNIHTFTNGAARPSDLDQSAVAAYLHAAKNDEVVEKVKRVSARLLDELEKVLGKQWADTWWKGLTKANDNKHLVEHNQIVWLYNCLHAYGLYHYAKDRYGAFEGNSKKWDETLSPEENLDRMLVGWGFVPGLALKPDVDYSSDFVNMPEQNKDRVLEAETFVYEWLATKPKPAMEKKDDGGGDDKRQKLKDKKIPRDWEDAYDMRTWKDFPDRIKRQD